MTHSPSPLSPSHRGRRAAVMILTLWIVVILMVITYSLAYEMRIGVRMTSHGKRLLRARGLARVGMAKAVMDLRNDRLIAVADPRFQNDTLDEIWADIEDKTDVEYGDGIYTVRIIDEDRKIDLNTLTPIHVDLLRHLLVEVGGMREDDSEVVADAILDFMDPDLQPQAAELEDEIEYYTEWGLNDSEEEFDDDWSFRPKNDRFLSVEELIEIPGITREMLYGSPEDTPQDPLERADWEEESFALIDYLTVGSSGAVNINTCGLGVLEALLVGATHGGVDVDDLVREIDKLRTERNQVGDVEGYGITSLDQLDQADVDPAILTMLRETFRLDVRSSTFTIISRGEYRGVRETMEARVQIQMQTYPFDPDDPDSFGLRDERVSGWLKDQPGVKVDPAVHVIRQYEQ
jgi:hypothetical protein